MEDTNLDTCTDLLYYIVGFNEVIVDSKFIDYIDEFAYILTNILKKGRKWPTIDEFSEYLSSDPKDYLQQTAIKVYSLLKKKVNERIWKNSDTLELESCLYRLISASVFNDYIKNKKSCRKAANERHKEDNMLRDFVNNLNDGNYSNPKDFMKRYGKVVIEFIQENCLNIYKNYIDNDLLIDQRIDTIFYRKK